MSLGAILFLGEILFRAPLWMKKVGGLPCVLWSYDTCEHHGRVFSFAPDKQRKLVVSEVFLDDEVEVKEVNTGVDCKCSSFFYSSCCSFGDKILVMAGELFATDLFCALVSIDLGELTEESIHIEEKNVIGWEVYQSGPFLAQISENKVWASFHNSNEIWIGEAKGNELLMTKHPDHLPMSDGFGAAPLRLPDGRFLAAGGCPLCSDITLITPAELFSFEKIGNIPGEERYCVSTILIKERFVVGFGGCNDDDMDDMWIFDLQTKKASPVAREGDWHLAVSWPFLAIKDDILYIVGGQKTQSVHSITFQSVSELIQDLDLQPVFQRALGLELRRYPADRTDNGEFRGMRDLGGSFSRHFSRNTIDHQGRVFHFFHCERKLCVTEILFGPWLKTRTVNTGVDCKTSHHGYMSCCPLSDKILVMAGEQYSTKFFYAIVSIDPGELTRESIHVEEKKVIRWESWGFGPYLAHISEDRVWASFYNSDKIWIGEVKGGELLMTKHQDNVPMVKGFGAPPLLLPDGKFLAAGGCPYSTKITLITPGKRFSFEKIGDMPGEGRDSVSTILIGERFVVGFGGRKGKSVDDMWIFDLQTKKASPVKKEGEWHPGTFRPVLVVRDKELYVIGGGGASSAHSLSFTALSCLIQRGRVRCAFCSCLGFPFRLVKGFKRSAFRHYSPPSL